MGMFIMFANDLYCVEIMLISKWTYLLSFSVNFHIIPISLVFRTVNTANSNQWPVLCSIHRISPQLKANGEIIQIVYFAIASWLMFCLWNSMQITIIFFVPSFTKEPAYVIVPQPVGGWRRHKLSIEFLVDLVSFRQVRLRAFELDYNRCDKMIFHTSISHIKTTRFH